MPSLPFQTANWNTHSEVKLREIEYPLEGEQSHFIVRRTYEGPKATYASLALDTADAEFATAYFVRQGPLVDVDGGCVRYERIFATVPAQWNDHEEFAFTFPAYIVGIAFGNTFSVTNIAPSAANYVLTTAATGISATDSVYLDLNYIRNVANYHVTAITPAVAATSSVSVTIGGVLPGGGAFSDVVGTLKKGQIGRNAAETLIVGSRLQHDYALSSDTEIDTDLPIIDKFSPRDNAGYEPATLSGATTPTATRYNGMIDAGTELVAERSTRRRYMGNIYVRITRLVKAK